MTFAFFVEIDGALISSRRTEAPDNDVRIGAAASTARQMPFDQPIGA
jgi:hypothetical protein